MMLFSFFFYRLVSCVRFHTRYQKRTIKLMGEAKFHIPPPPTLKGDMQRFVTKLMKSSF